LAPVNFSIRLRRSVRAADGLDQQERSERVPIFPPMKRPPPHGTGIAWDLAVGSTHDLRLRRLRAGAFLFSSLFLMQNAAVA
jgi:hypothetical protein